MSELKLFRRSRIEEKVSVRDRKINYNLPKKKEEITVTETTRSLRTIQIWNKFGENLDTVQRIKIPSFKHPEITKTYKLSIDCSKWLLNGSLFNKKEFVPPKFNGIDKRAYNLVEFKRYLKHYEYLVRSKKDRFLFNTKLTLIKFILGDNYTQMPSVLFSKCINPPAGFKESSYYDEETKDVFESLIELNPNIVETPVEVMKISEFLEWGLPYYTELWENLHSLRSYYSSPSGALLQFTFGALKQFKEKGKSVSPSLLNQPFFKDMIEEYRKFQGFVD